MKILPFLLSATLWVGFTPYLSAHATPKHETQDITESTATPFYTGSDFKELVEGAANRGLPFVDKTLFIQEIIHSSFETTLITRPHGWGKSINLSMLKYFFQPEVDNNGNRLPLTERKNRNLFKSLKISNVFDMDDIRKIVHCLLLPYAIQDNIGGSKELVREVLLRQGAPQPLIDGLLKGDFPREEIEQACEHIRTHIKAYQESLLTRFSTLKELPALLEELAEDGKIYSSPYRDKFWEIQKKIYTTLQQDSILKAQFANEFSLFNRYQGQYPVIYVSFKGAKGDSFLDLKRHVMESVYRAYQDHEYLFKPLDPHEASSSYAKIWAAAHATAFYTALKAALNDTSLLGNIDFSHSLEYLSAFLHEHYGTQTYILVDAYEDPAVASHGKEYQEKVLDLVGSLLEPALKGNPHLEHGILTGTLTSLRSYMGCYTLNLDINTVLSNRYHQFYGFTESEVDKLFEGKRIDAFRYPEDGSITQPVNQEAISPEQALKQELNRVYNGYLIEGMKIYNPRSIVSVFTSHIMKSYVESCDMLYDIKDALFSHAAYNLWKNIKDKKPFSLRVEQTGLVRNLQEPWELSSLLFHMGYLTSVEEPEGTEEKVWSRTKNVTIPNEEVRAGFEKLLNLYVFEKLNINTQSFTSAHAVFDAIVNQDTIKLKTALTALGSKMVFSKEWNFNFLQLATLTGNQEIFEHTLAYDASLRDNRLGKEQGCLT